MSEPVRPVQPPASQGPAAPFPAGNAGPGAAPPYPPATPNQRPPGYAAGVATPRTPPPPDQTTALAPGEAPLPRRSRFTIGVALAALLVAVLSAALSVYAIGVASGQKNGGTPVAQRPTGDGGQQTGGGGGVQPTQAVTTQAAASKTPAVVTSPGELNPRANFTSAYTPETQKLIIHAPQFGDNWVDLDKPQVGADSGISELAVNVNGNQETIRFGQDVKVATATSADLQASDCADLIQRSALADRTTIPTTTPTIILCVVTSFQESRQQGISWKIALMNVTSVGNDGTVQADVKAWNIPTG